MARRSHVLSHEALTALFDQHPIFQIFRRDNCSEYLEVLALLYDRMEEKNHRLEQAEARRIVEGVFQSRGVEFKVRTIQTFTLMIEEWGVLKDAHDAQGQRFFEPTRQGKRLLRLVEQLAQERPTFTGTGAETMVRALFQMLHDPREMSLEQALAHHEAQIQKLREDMERMRKDGVQASEILQAGHSQEELFRRAEDEANQILTAAEDVKLALEEARKTLISEYLARASPGETIDFMAEYIRRLAERPEYRSYDRSRDILSHIDGLGGLERHRDIDELVARVRQKGILSQDQLSLSVLSDFGSQFQKIVRSIGFKRQQQMDLLGAQVQQAFSRDSRRIREELAELHALFYKMGAEGTRSLFASGGLEISEPPRFEMGKLKASTFELPMSIDVPPIALNSMDSEEQKLFAELLKRAEEATIQKVLEKIQIELDQRGEIRLSSYPITMGLVEYYVLSEVHLFSDLIAAEKTPEHRFDLTCKHSDYVNVVRSVPEQRFFLLG